MSYEPPPLEPELVQLEAKLRTLQPLASDFTLMERLEQAMAESRQEHLYRAVTGGGSNRVLPFPFPWRRYGPAAAAAAAAFVVVIPLVNSNSDPTGSADNLKASPPQLVAPGPAIPEVWRDEGARDPLLDQINRRMLTPAMDQSSFLIPEAPAQPAGAAVPTTRGFLGICVNWVFPGVRAQLSHLDLPEDVGISVCGLVRDGPAHLAGIRCHDIIVAVNGRPVTSAEGFCQLIHRTSPGTEVKLDIVRGGKRSTVPVKLVAAPSA